MGKTKKRKSRPHFITQTDLAGILGISRSTVAAALNPNSPNSLRKETVEMVRATAEKLNYQPHHHARIMRGGRSGIIGILSGLTGSNDIHFERMHRLVNKLRSAGFESMVVSPGWYENGAEDAAQKMLLAKVEGVIIASCFPSRKSLRGLLDARIPIVTLSSERIAGIPSVQCDVENAVYELTVHLISLGRCKLVFCTPAKLSPNFKKFCPEKTLERLRGFCRAVLDHGGRVSKADIRALGINAANKQPGASRSPLTGKILSVEKSSDWYNPYGEGQAAIEQLAASQVMPDALMCTNDDWAVGAMSEAIRRSIKIPEELAITGFDDSTIANVAVNSLTTISQPIMEMIDVATDVLLSKISNPSKKSKQSIFNLPCKLVLRESCGRLLKK